MVTQDSLKDREIELEIKKCAKTNSNAWNLMTMFIFSALGQTYPLGKVCHRLTKLVEGFV